MNERARVGALLLFTLLVLFLIALLQSGWLEQYQENISFRPTVAGSRGTEDGVLVSFSKHVSEGGQSVETSLETRETPEKAKLRLEYYVSMADRIVEHTAKLDVDGNKVGDRFVTVFPNNSIAILWTENENLRTVASKSMKHALEFERQLSGRN